MRRPLLLYWSWVFLGLSIVAITLALTDLAGSATGIAYVVFIIFVVAYLGSFFGVAEDLPRSHNEPGACTIEPLH